MFYIYKDFVNQGILSGYTSIRWTRKFNQVSEIEITMPFNKTYFNEIKDGTIIYNEDSNEYCLIKDVNCYTNALGEKRVIFDGYSLLFMLKSRVHQIKEKGKLSVIVAKILNETIIKPTNVNRRASNFVIGNIYLKNDPIVEVEHTSDTELDIIFSAMTQEHNIGYSIHYDIENLKYVFSLSEGKETTIEFKPNFRTVKEQELYILTSNYKNTCKIGDVWVNDNNKGFDRYETSTSKSTDETELIVANKFLNTFKKIKSIDSVINTDAKQYEYLVDWNLGDIVICSNEDWNIEIKRNILEIVEFYEKGKFNISVVFGDYIPLAGGKK